MSCYNPNRTKPGSVMEPDTFWELVERLLLRSAKKQHSLQTQNASLTALCRGHALPQLPRQQKARTREHGIKPRQLPQKQQLFCKCPNVPMEGVEMEGSRQPTEQIGKEEKWEEKAKTKPKGILKSKSNPRTEELNCQPDKEHNHTIKKTKSECQINELDVEFVNDAEIPASEQLWRYAMRNKKKNEIHSQEKANLIPSARSNEAIYKGLKKRIDDAYMEERQRKAASLSDTRTDRKANTRLKRKQQHNTTVIVDIKAENNKCSNQETTSNVESEPSLPERDCTKEPISIRQVNSVPIIPADITRPLKCKRPHVMPIRTGVETHKTGREAGHSKQDINASRAMYDNVIKKRLTCGNQLESLNKEMTKSGNTRYVLSNDTMRKYNDLKSDYLSLCYQESQLRHEIAVLHAEIYMMQNKGFHKRPASVKTITLDSKTARLHAKTGVTNVQRYQLPPDDVPLFPPLKAPRPLILSPGRAMAERMAEKHPVKGNTEVTKQAAVRHPVYEGSGETPAKGTCTVYSLTPDLIPLPKPTPVLSLQAHDRCFTPLTHRLPRLRSTET